MTFFWVGGLTYYNYTTLTIVIYKGVKKKNSMIRHLFDFVIELDFESTLKWIYNYVNTKVDKRFNFKPS